MIRARSTSPIPIDDEPFDCESLQKLIKAIQRDWPDEPLLFIVDRSTIDGYLDAESQLLEASEKSGALVISSVRAFSGVRGGCAVRWEMAYGRTILKSPRLNAVILAGAVTIPSVVIELPVFTTD
jgi:hypothetical protein